MSSLESSDLAYAFLSLVISVSRMDMRAPPASPSPLSIAPAVVVPEFFPGVLLLVLLLLAAPQVFPPRKEGEDERRNDSPRLLDCDRRVRDGVALDGTGDIDPLGLLLRVALFRLRVVIGADGVGRGGGTVYNTMEPT